MNGRAEQGVSAEFSAFAIAFFLRSFGAIGPMGVLTRALPLEQISH